MADDSSESAPSSRSWRRWVAAGLFLVFFVVIMREVVNPYRGQRFEKIPHGDHVHYVPRDRNPDASVSRFPTQKPAADERITPDGQVVSPNDGNRTP
ncbi:hypothetical protein [Salinibacter grassmerensis]|uniref:hypothetical protein n=1 Tax=Salinibacter grassmerensis TaxID=3040353 RepID=UPI0021E9496B|nr:hypothetical protein [Salinibacter grassmerensis]